MHSAYYSNSKKSNSTKFIRTDSLSKHSCFRDIAEIQAVHFYFKKFDSTSPPVPVANSFIHSTLLRAPIGIEFNFYLNGPGTHADTRDTLQEQGFYMADPSKLLENKFYRVYRLWTYSSFISFRHST